MSLKVETKEKLKKVSTATISTLLYKRGLKHQVIQDVHPIGIKDENMVGEAFTVRTIPGREDLNDISVFRDPKHPQRVAVETCPKGHIIVIDSRKDASCASGGDILVSRMMMRGVAGVVSDGGFRDAMNIAKLDIHAYHNRPGTMTNLALHQTIDINVPIACGNAPIYPGDIIVGDQDSVIVIPSNIADEIADEAVPMNLYEDFVLDEVLKGSSIIGLYPQTDDKYIKRFEDWKRNKR